MADNFVRQEPKATKASNKGVFSLFGKVSFAREMFKDGVPTAYVPYVLYLVLLGLLYVALAHSGDRLQRDYLVTKREVQDLRFDYMTLKADYMLESMQSNLAKQVEGIDMIQPDEPPFKIEVE
jgi:hypothetical protein